MVILIVLLGPVVSVRPVPAAPASPAPARYWVVGPPRDGQRDYLYGIALRTLGDGARYREILALNRDRPQPDGGRLTDALTPLRTGWVLELPPDARGTGVQVGVVPIFAPKPEEHSTARWPGAVAAVVLALALIVVLSRVRRRRAIPARGDLTTVLEPVDRAGDHRLTVRLLGPDEAGPVPYGWVKTEDSLPGARIPVVVGRRRRRRFVLDLAVTPGVFTITGPPPVARRHAADLTVQLGRAGVVVVAVGDVLGEHHPPGITRVPDIAAARSAVGELGAPAVVVSDGLRGAQLATV